MVNTELGWALRMARLGNGILQRQVADWLNVSLWTYNRVENGYQPFRSEWLLRLPPIMRNPVAEHIARNARKVADSVRPKTPVPAAPRRPALARPVGAAQPRPVARVMPPAAMAAE